jgi:hypothetical protein
LEQVGYIYPWLQHTRAPHFHSTLLVFTHELWLVASSLE